MNQRVYAMPISDIYPLYLNKVERKGQAASDVDTVILWLTGYSPEQFQKALKNHTDLESFFTNAPHLNDHADDIGGSICGVKIQEITDPIMKNVRQMDKLVDEVAKGRPMEKILRS